MYLVHTKVIDHKQNRVAVKSMFYLSIIPRLQRIFASMRNVSHMTWNHTNRTSSGMMKYSSNGEAYKHFDRVHHEFSVKLRNVRLGLCSYGFTLYIQTLAISYSYCQVIVTPYSLLRDMCMKNLTLF